MRERRALPRAWLSAASYASIAAALGVVVLLGLWGTSRDILRMRALLRQSEINRYRSHAVRTVGQLERSLEESAPERRTIYDIDVPWLRRHWQMMQEQDPMHVSALVVDPKGVVVAHVDRARDGTLVRSTDRIDPLPGYRETEDFLLESGRRLYEIETPIVTEGKEIGYYRTGIDADRMDALIEAAGSQFQRQWVLVMSGVAAVVVLAALSLMHLNRQAVGLQNVLDRERLRQAEELGKMVATLAHEIRNPMNAIRLNLHAARKALEGHSTLSEGELVETLVESEHEVERIESLLKQLLSYTRGDEPSSDRVDLAAELSSIMTFMQPSLDEANIHVSLSLPAEPVWIRMAQPRLRQVLLNMLNNAREAIEGDGEITVSLGRKRRWAELVVQDSGPGVPAGVRERIFEPFFTTKAAGAGVGLTLVRKFAREAGGDVRCETLRGGAAFRLVLPIEESPLPPEAAS